MGASRTDSIYQVDICPGNIFPGDICSYQEYLSCYWPDLDETLKVGSWEHLEQTPTVTATFVQAIFVLATFVHIRNISTVTDLSWPNCKGRILEPFLKYANWHYDICPCKICPGNIYPNQQYLSYYSINFDQTIRTQFFLGHSSCGPKCSWTKLLWQ